MAPDGNDVFCCFLSQQSWIQKHRGRTWPFFELFGKVLGYFGRMLVDFWGYFTLFSGISRYIALFYDLFTLSYASLSMLHNFTFIFDSMIIYLTGAHMGPGGEGAR